MDGRAALHRRVRAREPDPGDKEKNQMHKIFTKVLAVIGLAGMAATGLPTPVSAQCQAATTNACNPCNPCNPCAAANPCNPCAAAKACNPCNPCNPCAAKNPCSFGR